MMEKLTNTLTEQIDVLANIATEFASFAKMPQAKNVEVDLLDIIKTNIVLYERDKNCTIHLYANDSESFKVYADKEQLSRVFSNLLKNAIQSFKPDITGEILIEVKKEDANINIMIKDNGTGIPQEIQHKIFTPNFTTKSGGTGLGLAIVKNIIISSGGTIRFESEHDKGTTFHILIPSID
jgi:signal transduction histidine kinase